MRRETYAAMQKDLLKELTALINRKTEEELFYGMEIAKYLRDFHTELLQTGRKMTVIKKRVHGLVYERYIEIFERHEHEPCG